MLALLALAQCKHSDRRDISDYYFPVKTLGEGLVYAYSMEMNGEAAPPEYWYYRTFVRDSGTFFTATYYDRHFEIGQIVHEKITASGSLAREYVLYQPDTLTGKSKQIKTRLEANNIFPYEVGDSTGVFLFSMSYQPLGDTATTISIIRNRRFLGEGPAFVLDGKKYPTVRFGLREAISNTQEGTAEVEGSGEEHYAKGLGLVYSSKTFGNGKLRFTRRLNATFPMVELERRAEMHRGEHDHEHDH